MILLINDVEYNVEDALNNVSLGNLDILQKSTREDGFKGITRTFIKRYFNDESSGIKLWTRENPDGDQDDLFAEEDFRRAIVGIIFLARRRAGEDATVKQAQDTLITEFRLISESQAEADADPKEAPAVEATEGISSPTS